MINEFIIEVCDILGIEQPEVSGDTSHFQSDTMTAQCDPDGRVIFLKEYEKQNPELYLAMAHELRHLWQYDNNFSFFFLNYKTVDQCATIDEYNTQPAEIDANAFAYIIMVDFFGMKPLFHGLSDFVKSKILERVSEIVSENQRADS